MSYADDGWTVRLSSVLKASTFHSGEDRTGTTNLVREKYNLPPPRDAPRAVDTEDFHAPTQDFLEFHQSRKKHHSKLLRENVEVDAPATTERSSAWCWMASKTTGAISVLVALHLASLQTARQHQHASLPSLSIRHLFRMTLVDAVHFPTALVGGLVHAVAEETVSRVLFPILKPQRTQSVEMLSVASYCFGELASAFIRLPVSNAMAQVLEDDLRQEKLCQPEASNPLSVVTLVVKTVGEKLRTQFRELRDSLTKRRTHVAMVCYTVSSLLQSSAVVSTVLTSSLGFRTRRLLGVELGNAVLLVVLKAASFPFVAVAFGSLRQSESAVQGSSRWLSLFSGLEYCCVEVLASVLCARVQRYCM